MQITVNNKKYEVVKHWFWDEFINNFWEPQTYDIYNKYIDKDTTYIDVGAWLGVTLIYAAQHTDKLYGIEANPLSYEMLKENCKQLGNVKLDNICITDKDNVLIGFGNGSTSSASSIKGDTWQVNSRTIKSYLAENKLTDNLFIKIDIEGAEELILDDLADLKAIIYLSIHPPFMKDKKGFCKRLLEFYKNFTVLDSKMQPLTAERLEDMITTDEQYTSWGTAYGNFFEILLIGGNYERN